MFVGKKIFSSALLVFGMAMMWLIVTGVQAHGTGRSIEIEVDEYLFDIGYSPEFVDENSQVRFDFQLLVLGDSEDEEDREEVDFDDVWVRIEKDDRLYYAGGLGQQRFGITGMSYRFMESGEYSVYVRFSAEGEAIADVTFPFPVAEVSVPHRYFDLPRLELIALLLIGTLLGGTLVWFMLRAQRKEHV